MQLLLAEIAVAKTDMNLIIYNAAICACQTGQQRQLPLRLLVEMVVSKENVQHSFNLLIHTTVISVPAVRKSCLRLCCQVALQVFMLCGL